MSDRLGAWATCVAVGCVLLAGCTPAPNPVEFSSSGDRLVFPWGAKGILHQINVDGTGLQALPATEGASGPRWAPGGDVVAFEQEDALVFYDLAQRHVTRRIEHGMAPVVWAPDGQRLGVFRNVDEHVVATWLRMPDLAEGHSIPLPVQRVSAAQTPRWLESRDGMAFMAANGDAYNVYTIEGEDVYRITGTGDVLGFGLAADGEHLLWMRTNPQAKDGGVTLWSYDLRLRSVRRLPFHVQPNTGAERQSRSAPVIGAVQFAPGAERLALIVERPREAVEVLTCALDGSQPKLIERATVARSRQKPHDLAYDSLSPCWSLDGQRLAVVKSGAHTGIRIYGADGGVGVKLPLPDPTLARSD